MPATITALDADKNDQECRRLVPKSTHTNAKHPHPAPQLCRITHKYKKKRQSTCSSSGVPQNAQTPRKKRNQHAAVAACRKTHKHKQKANQHAPVGPGMVRREVGKEGGGGGGVPAQVMPKGRLAALPRAPHRVPFPLRLGGGRLFSPDGGEVSRKVHRGHLQKRNHAAKEQTNALLRQMKVHRGHLKKNHAAKEQTNALLRQMKVHRGHLKKKITTPRSKRGNECVTQADANPCRDHNTRTNTHDRARFL